MAIQHIGYCRHCGMPLVPGGPGPLYFCRNCGWGLRSVDAAQATAPAQPPLFLVADLPYNAGLLRRVCAAFVDLGLGTLIALAAAGIAAQAAVIVEGRHSAAAGPLAWGVALAALLCYQPVFWARGGRTPGMLVFGIRVARADGSPLGALQAAARMGAQVLSALPLGLGLLWAARDQRGRAWHDILAGTVVVTAWGPPGTARPRS